MDCWRAESKIKLEESGLLPEESVPYWLLIRFGASKFHAPAKSTRLQASDMCQSFPDVAWQPKQHAPRSVSAGNQPNSMGSFESLFHLFDGFPGQRISVAASRLWEVAGLRID
jgi:hypothetical protein